MAVQQTAVVLSFGAFAVKRGGQNLIHDRTVVGLPTATTREEASVS